jgi:serine phosphatase RsbU (regulator of sigma subunit)
MKVKENLENYISKTTIFVKALLKTQGYTEDNQKLMQDSISSLKILKESVDSLFNNINDVFNEKLNSTNKELKDNLKNGIFGFIISFIVIFIIVYLLASRVSASIKEVSKSLELTNNNHDYLSLKLESNSKDELGDLTNSFNNSIGFLQDLHHHVQSSINAASYIQEAILPDHKSFDETFNDYFVLWTPRDTVGGDMYICEKLNDNETLLMVIDCTGHGIPGAFVTMIVKSITTEIVSNLKNSKEEISPSQILSYFNTRMKILLKQDQDSTKSNVGFDGGIIYINKEKNILKYSGAETALFVFEENKVTTIKGDRHSIGYKKSKFDYEFKEKVVDISSPKKIYITTDGYLDQTGGEKNFCFGRKKFVKLIEDNFHESFHEQKEIFEDTITSYQGNQDRKDDITVIGFEV